MRDNRVVTNQGMQMDFFSPTVIHVWDRPRGYVYTGDLEALTHLRVNESTSASSRGDTNCWQHSHSFPAFAENGADEAQFVQPSG